MNNAKATCIFATSAIFFVFFFLLNSVAVSSSIDPAACEHTGAAQ